MNANQKPSFTDEKQFDQIYGTIELVLGEIQTFCTNNNSDLFLNTTLDTA